MATYTGADKAVAYLFTSSNNTAAEYSSATTYAVGDFVIYEGILYKCTSAISSPEAWTPAHWTQTTIMDNAGGGGGGGTTVIANPAGAATDTLNKLQVGSTIYDIPSGGGSSGHTYSTTEQIVGTWVDGSTIYEKTYNTGALPNNNNKDTAHGVTNLGIVLQLFGFAIRPSDNTKLTLPLVNPDGIQNQIAVTIRGDYIRITTRIDRSNFTESYIVMQYTKTS